MDTDTFSNEQVISYCRENFINLKINTDTENRQTFLSALLGAITGNGTKIDIRYYDNISTDALAQSYIQKLIMAGNYGVWHEPKINVEKFKFTLRTRMGEE